MTLQISDLDTFMSNRFSKLFPDLMYEGYGDFESNEIDILYEIENYGIETISDLEKIIPHQYIEAISTLEIKLNYLGTLRMLLILNDPEKYIQNYNEFNYRNFWEIANIKNIEPLFDYFTISTDAIITQTKEHNNM